MPKEVCKCGNVISLGEIPNPNEWLIISDVDFDKFSGNIDSDKIFRSAISMLQCGRCGRLLIYWKGFKSPPEYYFLEKSSE